MAYWEPSRRRAAFLEAVKTPLRMWVDDQGESFDGETGSIVTSTARACEADGLVEQHRHGDAVFWRITLDGRKWLYRALTVFERRNERKGAQQPAVDRAKAVNAGTARRAAADMAPRVAHALEVLGGDVPEHLVEVARLRVEHPTLSLGELGAMLVPPLTKSTVHGRLVRLLDLAGQRTGESGKAA